MFFFLDAPSISIRGCVRPLVRPLVRRSVRRSRFRKNRWKWRYAVMQLCSYALCSARRILCRVYGLVFIFFAYIMRFKDSESNENAFRDHSHLSFLRKSQKNTLILNSIIRSFWPNFLLKRLNSIKIYWFHCFWMPHGCCLKAPLAHLRCKLIIFCLWKAPGFEDNYSWGILISIDFFWIQYIFYRIQ